MHALVKRLCTPREQKTFDSRSEDARLDGGKALARQRLGGSEGLHEDVDVTVALFLALVLVPANIRKGLLHVQANPRLTKKGLTGRIASAPIALRAQTAMYCERWQAVALVAGCARPLRARNTAFAAHAFGNMVQTTQKPSESR